MARRGQTVTRYSHNPLAKKFKCDECGEWFRTLQGLSGHVRFKHESGRGSDGLVNRLTNLTIRKAELRAYGSATRVPRVEIEARLKILDEWQNLIVYCESFGVRPSAQDYKNFVIRSYYARLDRSTQ